MFVIDRTGEIVGYSRWPWDSLYAPAVGCFNRGRLVEVTIADLPWQEVGLHGPLERWWFRMRLDPDLVRALEEGEPEIRLMRLEDAKEIGYTVDNADDSDRLLRVEALLSATSNDRNESLTGFTDFLEAPQDHQIEVIYRDILGRKPDEPGMQSFRRGLASGQSILDRRRDALLSSEFRGRDVRASDRVGSMLTSPLWTLLAGNEPLGEKRRSLRTVRLSDYDEVSDLEFVSRFHELVQQRPAGGASEVRLEELAVEHGRPSVASIVLRDAASAGLFWRLLA